MELSTNKIQGCDVKKSIMFDEMEEIILGSKTSQYAI